MVKLSQFCPAILIVAEKLKLIEKSLYKTSRTLPSSFGIAGLG